MSSWGSCWSFAWLVVFPFFISEGFSFHCRGNPAQCRGSACPQLLGWTIAAFQSSCCPRLTWLHLLVDPAAGCFSPSLVPDSDWPPHSHPRPLPLMAFLGLQLTWMGTGWGQCCGGLRPFHSLPLGHLVPAVCSGCCGDARDSCVCEHC